jgi:hypothetical protein
MMLYYPICMMRNPAYTVFQPHPLALPPNSEKRESLTNGTKKKGRHAIRTDIFISTYESAVHCDMPVADSCIHLH